MNRNAMFTRVAGITLAAMLSACGGDDDAPALTVVGSMSSVKTARTQPWYERMLVALVPAARAQVVGGGATALKMRFYTLYASPNADCTSPILVADHGAAAIERDLADGPVLFEGSPPAGTYRCLIVKASDLQKITPDDAAPTPPCMHGVEFTRDLYREPDTDFQDLAGHPITAHGTDAAPIDDTVYFFASTDIAAVPSASPNQTLLMSGPLVVPGRTTFYLDPSGGVTSNGSTPPYCAVENAHMGFR